MSEPARGLSGILPTPQELANVTAAAGLIQERADERQRLGAHPRPCGAEFAHPSHETRHDLGGGVVRWYRCPGAAPVSESQQ